LPVARGRSVVPPIDHSRNGAITSHVRDCSTCEVQLARYIQEHNKTVPVLMQSADPVRCESPLTPL
jgi:hypothetical protein